MNNISRTVVIGLMAVFGSNSGMAWAEAPRRISDGPRRNGYRGIPSLLISKGFMVEFRPVQKKS